MTDRELNIRKNGQGVWHPAHFLNDNLSILIQTGFFHESAVNGADEALKALCVGNIHDCTLDGQRRLFDDRGPGRSHFIFKNSGLIYLCTAHTAYVVYGAKSESL